MFCSRCGRSVEAGMPFCKHCGARLAAQDPQVTEVRTPEPPLGSPSGPPPASGRTGLVVGIVVAVIVILGGAGTAAWLLLRDGEETATVTTQQAVDVITDGSTETTTGPEEGTGEGDPQSGATSTSQTLPDLGTSTTASPGLEEATLEYVALSEEMVDLLVALDVRIPELAEAINASAPRVPRAIWEELEAMMGSLDGSFTSLAQVPVPQGFEDCDDLLAEAAMAMGNRIDATIRGIEAMWDTGRIPAALEFFEMGREARDEYRYYMEMYEDALPIG